MKRHEVTTVRAVVRAFDGHEAIVEVTQQGCGRCHEKGGCGGQQLTQMFCAGPKTYRLDNAVACRIGDEVEVAVATGTIRRTANLVYGIPLLAVVCGAMVGAWVSGEGGAILGALFAFFFSYLMVARYLNRSGNSDVHPYIVSCSSSVKEANRS